MKVCICWSDLKNLNSPIRVITITYHHSPLFCFFIISQTVILKIVEDEHGNYRLVIWYGSISENSLH